ncbi:hypothetical protein D7D94_11480 [Microbacterium oryzae]|uniref:Uncharacterized protein n=2 Tax=Microbacterium oryzae TaxID=743009 RepID=A0A6I6E621_9MICO|nr:hypothetical protein D7D94_11480 [Microbacterium oryzae]
MHMSAHVDALRPRIPGRGIEREEGWLEAHTPDPSEFAAPWALEDRMDGRGRERSIEYPDVTPVYGSAQPLQGVSGAIRRYAYGRYSENTLRHWLLLVAGDRVESFGAHARSLFTLRPDNPITQTGVLGEFSRHPIGSRVGRGRIDHKHAWLDPILIVGPWVLTAVLSVKVLGKVFGGSKR